MDANGQRKFGPEWAVAYCKLFRRIAILTSLLAAAIGWQLHIDWLPWAALCIGLGEFLETTYYIAVMRWGRARLQSPGHSAA